MAGAVWKNFTCFHTWLYRTAFHCIPGDRRGTAAEADYYEAAQQYALYQKSDSKESFDKLQGILARRPELHPKYDGLLAQILINRDEPQAAETYANLVFNRVRNRPCPLL